jgi:hypothetical protein
MATTTNYGWTTPDNTDLVKDGALAIRTLGSAIDTSMNTALGTKKAGMVLLNTTSFSGVASQSINDVFSATYDYYKIFISVFGSALQTLNVRLRVSGADNSSSIYNRERTEIDSTSVVAARATNQSLWQISEYGATANTTTSIVDMSLAFPFLAQNTVGQSFNTQLRTEDGVRTELMNFNHKSATSFTGYTLLAGAGTISGKVITYGLNQ